MHSPIIPGLVPRGCAARPGHARGFTLIELMVVVSIVAIVASYAVPSMRSLIADQKVKVVASDLAQEIAFTRASAVASGRRTIIAPTTAGNWLLGWHIYTDVNGDNAYTAGTDIELKKSPPTAANVNICTNVAAFANSIIFHPDGSITRVAPATANDGITISLDMGTGHQSDLMIRTLYFGPSGRVSVILQNGGVVPGSGSPGTPSFGVGGSLAGSCP